MKKLMTIVVVGLVLTVGSVVSADGPYTVGAAAKCQDWASWGYTVDGQTSANWLAVDISWGTEAGMSGTYYLQEDLIFRVDPSTSGLADPHSVYDDDWWNHDDVYGLGEFFDAGYAGATQDDVYSLVLTLGVTDTWAVLYDANGDQVNDGGAEHNILGGTVTSYWNRDGKFYGVLVSDDGKFDGYFNAGHDEGTPDLVNGTFHAGYGDPIPEPATLGMLAIGSLTALIRRKRKRQ